ncbi:MAG: DUF21 domain-containing protein [Pseudonocardiaceae bacterium]|nr:DUF21 domain-containing protein [Pseudonocardiaceae bacterium]
MNDGLAIALGVLLLALNAFFVGAEFALVSSRRDRLEAMAKRGVNRARTVIKASEQVSMMMAGAQLGITACTIGLGALAEPAVAHVLEGLLEPFGIPAAAMHAVAFAIALVIVVVLHILLGEMVTKNIAIAAPERTAIWLVPAHVLFMRALRPVVALFNAIANAVLRLVRVTPKDELDSAYTPQELASLIGQSREEGLLQASEHRRLAQTLSSTESTVADVLVPLDELITVPAQPTVGDVEAAVSRTGFSRFPLRTSDGHLAGYLHVKDVLDQAGADPATPVPSTRLRGLPELPVDARLDEALTALRRAGSHLGSAVTSGGQVLGVVALEDVVEEYVGTVRDETHVGSRKR